LVSAQQNEAISGFTREYGPRTSVIQRRLRSVYGFDDIEIQSKESTITVRVKRHGEELRPIDYFSQSQQQTLLLGLFLTACISQTWSGFAPVFMDDPVTHFDDLNTYAFLDLIVGLLESDVGKRQFIISTVMRSYSNSHGRNSIIWANAQYSTALMQSVLKGPWSRKSVSDENDCLARTLHRQGTSRSILLERRRWL
jgi:hypothetical protein